MIRIVRGYRGARRDRPPPHDGGGGRSQVRRATGLRPAEWARPSVVTSTGSARCPGQGHENAEVTSGGAAHQDGSQRARQAAGASGQPLPVTTTRKVPGLGGKGPFDVADFRRREWGPAVDAAGVATPARIYDLRSTFASNALAGWNHDVRAIMGTSVGMIEAHDAALIDPAHDGILARLEALS